MPFQGMNAGSNPAGVAQEYVKPARTPSIWNAGSQPSPGQAWLRSAPGTAGPTAIWARRIATEFLADSRADRRSRQEQAPATHGVKLGRGSTKTRRGRA